MKREIFFLIICILGAITLISLTRFNFQQLSKKYCLSDYDCVAATCCHSTECVNKRYAPNCTNTLCTLECKPGTLDCNYGYCACINNKCEALIKMIE